MPYVPSDGISDEIIAALEEDFYAVIEVTSDEHGVFFLVNYCVDLDAHGEPQHVRIVQLKNYEDAVDFFENSLEVSRLELGMSVVAKMHS